jgi:hypothetical protein
LGMEHVASCTVRSQVWRSGVLGPHSHLSSFLCSVQWSGAARKAAAAGVVGKETSCRAPWASWHTGPSLLDLRKQMGMATFSLSALKLLGFACCCSSSHTGQRLTTRLQKLPHSHTGCSLSVAAAEAQAPAGFTVPAAVLSSCREDTIVGHEGSTGGKTGLLGHLCSQCAVLFFLCFVLVVQGLCAF